MATQNLSNYNKKTVPPADDMRFAIIVSEWNEKITEALYKGAYETLIKHGAKKENIIKEYVPGSFELIYGAQLFCEQSDIDSVIILGAVIQGETRHFDFVCQGVTQGIAHLNEQQTTPVIFGLLTTDTTQQAEDRAGGKHGNKGDEAAVTAIKMVAFKKRVQQK